MAVVEHLVELLLGPGTGLLGAEVIEDKDGHLAEAGEGGIEPLGGAGGEGRTQLIEEVGDVGEADGVAGLEAVVRDGGGKVGLAAAGLPEEDEPAVGGLGPAAGGLEGALEAVALLASEGVAARVEGLEGERGEAVACHRADVSVAGGRAALEDEDLRERRVGEAGAEAGVDLLGGRVAGEDGGERRMEAVGDDLVELLASPGGGGVGIEVVEDGEGGGADLLDEALVGHLGVVVVGGAELVEEVGDGEEEGGLAVRDDVVGDRGGEVGLAAAGDAGEDEPALGVCGEAAGGLDGVSVAILGVAAGGAAARQQCVEGEAGERAEAGVAEQAGLALAVVLALGAAAGDGAAEVGAVGVGGDADEAGAIAERADLSRDFRSGG